jgi:SAM-dependent methyltransferase
MFTETVDPTRARRTNGILRALRDNFHGPFRVLDLGSGPGPLTVRILRRFPKSRVVALDTDPVLLRVGEVALSRFQGRATCVLADLRERTWPSQLPVHRFDAAVSSLALHWLEEDEIRGIYRELRRLLRPCGLLINGDFLPSSQRKIQAKGSRGATEPRRVRHPGGAGRRAFKSRWEKWWEALAEDPSMRDVLRERHVRMPGRIPPRRTTGPKTPVSLEAHQRALRDAGFRESVVTWQDGEFQVLVGIR